MQISSTTSYPNDKLSPMTWARLFSAFLHVPRIFAPKGHSHASPGQSEAPPWVRMSPNVRRPERPERAQQYRSIQYILLIDFDAVPRKQRQRLWHRFASSRLYRPFRAGGSRCRPTQGGAARLRRSASPGLLCDCPFGTGKGSLALATDSDNPQSRLALAIRSPQAVKSLTLGNQTSTTQRSRSNRGFFAID